MRRLFSLIFFLTLILLLSAKQSLALTINAPGALRTNATAKITISGIQLVNGANPESTFQEVNDPEGYSPNKIFLQLMKNISSATWEESDGPIIGFYLGDRAETGNRTKCFADLSGGALPPIYGSPACRIEANGSMTIEFTFNPQKLSPLPTVDGQIYSFWVAQDFPDIREITLFPDSLGKSIVLTFPDTVSLNVPPTLTWGDLSQIKVTGIPLSPSGKYDLVLARADKSYSMSFTVGNNKCSIDNGGDSATQLPNAKCILISNGGSAASYTYAFTTGLDTAKLPKPTTTTHEAGTGLVYKDSYQVTLTPQNLSKAKTASLAITNVENQVTLTLASYDNNGNKLDQLYEKSIIKALVKGCRSDTADITVTAANTTDGGNVQITNPPLQVSSDPVEIFIDKFNFEDDKKDQTISVSVTCNPSGITSGPKTFTIHKIGGGLETIQFLTNPIDPDQPWSIKLLGLNSVDDRCYYIRIFDSTGTFQPETIPAATPEDINCADKVDGSGKPYVYVFKPTSAEMTLDAVLPKLKDGIYGIYLIRAESDPSRWDKIGSAVTIGTFGGIGFVIGAPIPVLGGLVLGAAGLYVGNAIADNLFSMKDDVRAASPFCVGGGCSGLFGSDTVPCLIGLDKDENEVDATKESDLTLRKEMQDTIVKCTTVPTPLGPISTDPVSFLRSFFSIMLSISGGIALLLIIRSGYQLLVSQGDAEQVKAARERLTSAIVGLLFLIFSLVILQVIGVDILHIPGFS